jgi:hypothetical protein
MEGLERKTSHKIFGLQSVLPTECSWTRAWHNHDLRDFIQKLMAASAESHSQILNIASGVVQKMRKEDQRSKRGQGHHKKTVHRITLLWLSQAHRYQGAYMDLYICYGWAARCSCGHPNSGNRGCLWLLFLLVGRLSSYRASFSCLDVMLCSWSYCSLLCCDCLMSLGGLLFSEGRWGMDVREEGQWKEETGKRGGRRNRSWDVIYKRRKKIIWIILKISRTYLLKTFIVNALVQGSVNLFYKVNVNIWCLVRDVASALCSHISKATQNQLQVTCKVEVWSSKKTRQKMGGWPVGCIHFMLSELFKRG